MDKLNVLRKNLGLRQEDFAEIIGIGRTAYTMIERGVNDLTPRNRRIIEEKFNVHPRYLDGADVPMFLSEGTTEYKVKAIHEPDTIKYFVPDDMPKTIGKLHIAPIYESYPVSAGKLGLSEVREEKPDGYAYTTLPGVMFFPVVGCSFEPEIKAGEYIGVVKINSWDWFDTEKIYFILTREERMMKRLRNDNDDNNALWCVSPNFKEFKIQKEDIIEINHVFFHGKMV